MGTGFRHFVEAIEPRVMLSVSLNANGWTQIGASTIAGHPTQIIYVSAEGSDSNNGLSTATPVKSFARAMALTPTGQPDWILLKRGDVFHDSFSNWNKSGYDAQDPILIGTYGTGARPLIDTGTAIAGFATINNKSTTVNYLAVIGLQFYENNRDPASPTFNTSAAGGTTGFQFYAAGGNVLVEDCMISFYRNNIDIEGVNGSLSNITIRRCVVENAWSSDSHSQGIYSYNTTNITLFQNVFDHNGWNASISGAGQQGYNHDIYFSYSTLGADIEQNIIARASFGGIIARGGGTIVDNLFLTNAIALSYGNAEGADSTPGGVSGQISGNVVDGDESLGSTAYGEGFDIGNINPATGLVVNNNILTQDTQLSKDAIDIDMATSTYNPAVAVGVNHLTLLNNITYGWFRGYQSDGRFVNGGTGLYAFNHVAVLNNSFINSTNVEARHDGAFSSSEEVWSGNIYYDKNLSTSSWFQLQGVTETQAQWIAAVDHTGLMLTSAPPYADPTRGITSYDASLGGPGTLADFLAKAELLSDTNLNPAYMAQAVINYIRAGFSLDVSPPTASANLPEVTAASAGATTCTFTVTYTDNFFLNAASLGSGNLLMTGPNGFSQKPTFVSAAAPVTIANGYQQTVATYRITAPGGGWSKAADGTYTLALLGNQVSDTAGNHTNAGTIGMLLVDVATPASVSGTVFVDANANGMFDSGDTPLANVVVYVDLNGNGQLDAGEPSTTTDANGDYTLTGLPAGQYEIQEVLPAGYQVTTPVAGYNSILLQDGQAMLAVNFADQLISSGGSVPPVVVSPITVSPPPGTPATGSNANPTALSNSSHSNSNGKLNRTAALI